MIKIEHPEIDVIAQEYFDLISPIIVKGLKSFFNIGTRIW
jgi:hypothetical protein